MPGPNLSLTWSINWVTETNNPNRKTLIRKEGEKILNSTLCTDSDNAKEKLPLKEK
jgi:hypothetical protein